MDGSIATANANTDGTTGTYTTLHTGTSGGNDEIEQVDIVAAGTTTAGWIGLFVHDGTTAVMVAQIPVPPWTPVNTAPQIQSWRTQWRSAKPIRLPSTSHTLKASTLVAETFRLLAQGRKYV